MEYAEPDNRLYIGKNNIFSDRKIGDTGGNYKYKIGKILIIQVYKIMIRSIWSYFKAWIKGEDAELEINGEIEFAWWEVVLILGLIVWIIYLIWR